MASISTRLEFDNYDESLPENIFKEYDKIVAFKNTLDGRGLYEQTLMNERFILGKQWEDVDVGEGAPTPVINVIKQIIEYKISNITSNPIEAWFTFEGVPYDSDEITKTDVTRISNVLNSTYEQDSKRPAPPEMPENPLEQTAEISEQAQSEPIATTEQELNAVADALSAHYRTICERVQMDRLIQTGVRKAAISGSLVFYAPFDSTIKTGLFSSDGKTKIEGDIAVEIIDIANVNFSDVHCTDLQQQPSILVAQRKTVYEIARMAKMNKISQESIDAIASDEEPVSNTIGADETDMSKKATVITKFWKEYSTDGSCAVMCTKVCKGVTIKEKFDTGISLYPLCIFQWEERDNCIYGHSEITSLISNQTCINRLASLETISLMLTGLPKILINKEVITGVVTNNPGEIIEVESNADVQTAIRYMQPPTATPNWDIVQQNLIDNTKIISGANQASLGELRPENTSAIISLREAAALPLRPMQARFFSFMEDFARICGETIVKKYGIRKLKIEKDGKTYYIPFNGERYKDLLLSIKIDVGTSSIWGVPIVVSTLSNLLMNNKITLVDFLERIPNGLITKKNELIQVTRQREEQQAQAAQAQAQAEMQAKNPQPQAPEQENVDFSKILSELSDEELTALKENPEIMDEIMQKYQGTSA